MRTVFFVLVAVVGCALRAPHLFGEANVQAEIPPYEIQDEIPDLLAGIWQGSDRLLLFGKENSEFACVLREFYGRYADRAAEPARYAELSTRTRNDATHASTEHIVVRYSTIAENAARTAGAYELIMQYSQQKKAVHIPVCVIDGKLYLDFLVHGSASYTDREKILASSSSGVTEIPSDEGFWRDCGAASGILIAPPVIDKELVSYYFADGFYYHIRYWLCEMPYTYEKAYFSDGEKSFSVDKYVRIAGNVYTCATGRRTQIRNIEKASALVATAAFDSDRVFLAFGEPYLVRVDADGSQETLLASVDETNAQRAPLPKPLFPPTFPHVRWPRYEELELYNPATWSRRNLDIGK